MRLDINLASRKYEDVRSFYRSWGVSLTVLAVLVLALGGLTYLKFDRTRRTEKETRVLQDRIAGLQRVQEKALYIENLPENREVTEQKRYWNAQLARRAFSWTQLINDLQKIMPNRAYLNTVQPEITPDNRVHLRIMITGEKRDNARELQQRMETSNRFRSPWIKSETPENARPGMPATYKFEIESDYTPPEIPPVAAGGKKGA